MFCNCPVKLPFVRNTAIIQPIISAYQSWRFARDPAGIKCEPASGFPLDALTSLSLA